MGFLHSFFEERQPLTVNHAGEATVICPFPHDKGYETRPSAHVNLEKGVFHCKTCQAEGRFSEGGLSETSFVMMYYSVSYAEALKLLHGFSESSPDEHDWERAVNNLFDNQDLLTVLTSRGLTLDTIRTYQLGYTGSGIVYPVFLNGVLVDTRTYQPNYKDINMPKMASKIGAATLIFPFDHWKHDDRPTLLCAGENDCLIGRQFGFNAITGTGGEGRFPQLFLSLFKDKEVYICYDCDDAGRKGALAAGFDLFSAGAIVRIIDLGLPGSKEDKDLTDYFIKHNHSADDLYKLMQQAYLYNGEMYQQHHDIRYPLVNLWEITDGKYQNKYLSSRVMMMGKFETQHGAMMDCPTSFRWQMLVSNEDPCDCDMCKQKTGIWSIDENPEAVLELVETDKAKQHKALDRILPSCKKNQSGRRWDVVEHRPVMRAVFAPDVETEDELRGYRGAEIQGYVIDPHLEDGQKYRIYFYRYPHPRTMALVMVIDRVEQSDNAINRFEMTPEIVEQLSQFQGHPNEVMQKRFELAKRVVAPSAPRPVVEAVDIMYHSVLDFRFASQPMKGHPEGAIIGESRTGKSETAKRLKQFYGIGNHTELKNASVAGLIGGAESQGNGYRIKWGEIPRNNRGLLILDEASGISREMLGHLTGVRSEREAVIKKIVAGRAPALTRMLWIANPRVQSDGKSKPIALYPNGVQVVLDLFGSDEDVARFDFLIVLPPNKTYIPPFHQDELDKLDNTAYRNLIYWAWSRTSDQVKFSPGVEQYIWQVAQELNEVYDTDIKIFGPEAHKKLARIAVSVAVMCFSHDGTGNVVVVSKDHVDFAADFLRRCYDNDIFRLRDYVEQQKQTLETNEEVNNVFATLVHSQPMLMKSLANVSDLSLNQLQLLSGLDRNQFTDVVSNLARNGLIQTTASNVMPTLRFRKARDAYVNGVSKQKMLPLSQQGGISV